MAKDRVTGAKPKVQVVDEKYEKLLSGLERILRGIESDPQTGQKPADGPLSASRRDLSIRLFKALSFTGPVPPPEVVEHFEQVYPGSAKWIFERAQLEQAHRHSLEQKAVDAEIRDTRLGQWLGFSIGVLAIGIGGAVAILAGPITGSIAGSLIGGGGIVGLVYVFVQGRKSSK